MKTDSAKRILERCEASNPNNEKNYYKNSALIFPENMQNLETSDLKINLIDTLLIIENTTDYVPKPIKAKKKRKISKRI